MKSYKDFFLYLKGEQTFISRDGFSVTADEDSWFFGDASAYVLVTASTEDVYLEVSDKDVGSVGQYKYNNQSGNLSTQDILEFIYECRREFADRHMSWCQTSCGSDHNIKWWLACGYLISLLHKSVEL